jgi:hypothetical protein
LVFRVRPRTLEDNTVEITEMIEAVQKAVKVEVDGKAGPETWGAIYAALVKKTVGGLPPMEAISAVDPRSETNIATLLPELHPYARSLVQKAADVGIQIKIISGLRTFAEQDALFAQGRTAPGNKVTNARGGFSNHNFGIAFDVGVFEKQPLPGRFAQVSCGRRDRHGVGTGLGRQLELVRRPAAFPAAARLGRRHDRARHAGRAARALGQRHAGVRLGSAARRQHRAAAFAEPDAPLPGLHAIAFQHDAVAVLQEAALLAVRQRDRLLAAHRLFQQRSFLPLAVPDSVPDPNRSPALRLQPFTVWCATSCATVQ